jgi:phage tail-like protein
MSKHRHHKHHSLRVTWDGKTIAGVDRVSPLTRLVEVITVRDGSSPHGGEHTAPGRMTSAPVTLERPAGGDSAFEDWAASASSIGTRKDVGIEILNRDGETVLSYRLHRCWVTEYQASLLEPGERSIAIERLRLENDGWERIPI